MGAIVQFVQEGFCFESDVEELERGEVGGAEDGIVPVENEN